MEGVLKMSDESVEFLNSGVLAPIKRWGTRWSLWPAHFVTACCGVELAHAFACGYDGERWGVLNYGISRQTNFIIVEGAITRKMARALRFVWGQMPEPKFVIVLGACGQKGGLFWNGYNIVRPSDVVPVDFFVPGCPPTPEGLLRGCRAVQDKIEGIDRTTIQFKDAELPPKEAIEERLVPTTPKIFALTPAVRIDMRDENAEKAWSFGRELVAELSVNANATIIGMNRIALKTTREKMKDVALKLKEKGFDHVKSVNVVDVPHENKFIVEYVVSSYSQEELKPVLLSVFCEIPREDARVASLKDVWESADYQEREMHEFFGVWFEGNPWMGKKFFLAPDSPEYPLRKDFKLREARYVLEKGGEEDVRNEPPSDLELPVPFDLKEAHESDEYVVFVGPHHPGSGHLRTILRVKGDIITDAIPDPGYVHRGMEKTAENLLYIQSMPLFERCSIVDSANITLGYVRAIERALKIEVPERAKYIRMILAELSRIGTFLYDAAIGPMFLGHTTGFMYCFALREVLVDLLTKITGARITTSFIVPGGIRRDVPQEVLQAVKKFTSAVRKRWERYMDIFVRNPVTIARLKGVGVLSKEDAIRLGCVGPFLRASGVEYDVRKIEPYEAYDDVEFEIPVSDEGDALARFLVRVEEMKQSFRIIQQAVDALQHIKGEILSEDVLGECKDMFSSDIRGYFYRAFGNIVLPRGEFSAITEAARGSLLFSIISDGESNVPYRVKAATPCLANLRAFMEAVKGERLADFWAIYISFGYFPPEADR
ncbi:MAG: NADH-quinone oxidoreductase subunit D [Candidatus Methanospirare jalkutatii]|nr:NADH-quinone oxidoreductase subunit D [Candidatus Methanospirare jalkutatii]